MLATEACGGGGRTKRADRRPADFPASTRRAAVRRAFAAASQLLPSLRPSWSTDVAEPHPVNKPAKSYPRPLSDLLHKTLHEAFAKQGFASTELVTRWS